MANDADWVSEVKRWYFASVAQNGGAHASAPTEPVALGYEAAQPALETRPWLNSAQREVGEPR